VADLTPKEHAQGSGLLVRGYRAALEELGKLNAVRERLAPEVAQLLSEPPLPMSWVPVDWFIQVAEATGAVAGHAGCRRLGEVCARSNAGGVLAPLIKTSLAIFGATPPTLYRRLDTFTSVLVRHAGFDFVPDGPRGGTLKLHYSRAATPAFFATWEGVCVYVHALCGVPAEVAQARLEEGGLTAAIDVRW
jgi:hypothetical protein